MPNADRTREAQDDGVQRETEKVMAEGYEKEFEIFATGKWNGDQYTAEDLDNMVENFRILGEKWKVPLKLGHDKKQKLAQEDGYPALGWVKELKRVGDKLVALIGDIPQKIRDLIDGKRYGRISSEIIWNYQNGGNVYRRVLSGVALLGADMPAVTSITDVVGMFDASGQMVRAYDEKDYGKERKANMDEIKVLEDKLAAEQAKLTAEQAKVKAAEDAQAETKKQLAEAQAKVKASEADQVKVQTYALIDKAIADGKVAPAIREHLAAFAVMEFDGTEKVHAYKVGDEAKEIKAKSNADLLRGLIETMPKVINFAETSETSTKENTKKAADEILHEKIEALRKENKDLTYRQAYDLVTAEKEEVQ